MGGEERADRELSKPWHCVIMALDIHHHSSPQTLPLVSEVRDEKDIKVATYTSHLCIDYEIYEVMMETYKWEKPFSCARVKLFKQNSIATDLCRWPEYCNDFSSYDLKTVTYPLIIQEWLGVRFSAKKGVM